MEKKVWIMRRDGGKSHYAAGLILPLAIGIPAAMALLAGTVVLGLRCGLPMEQLTLAACLLITALLIWLAVRTGRKSLRDGQIFWQDSEEQLFAADLRQFAPARRDIFSQIGAALRVQKLLDQIPEGEVPSWIQANGIRLLSAEHIRERRNSWAAVCRVRYPNGGEGTRTFILPRGLEGEEELISVLQRMEQSEVAPQMRADRSTAGILVSLLGAVVFGGLCLMSHPAVGRLSSSIYFPMLGLTAAALAVLVYFAIRKYRGE